MCWSAQGSLGAYSLGMALAALSKYQGTLDPKMWFFMVLFTHMQLVEYFLWKNLSVPTLNVMWSAVGLGLILAEPAAALNMLSDKRLLALYTVGALTYVLTQPINFTTVVGGNGHLKWNWLAQTWTWGIPWIIALLVPFLLTKEYVALAFGLVTLFISLYFNNKYRTFASYWCWLGKIGRAHV